MFHRSRTLAVVREWAMRALSVTVALGPIVRLLQNPPDPERAVAEAKARAAGEPPPSDDGAVDGARHR